MCLAAGPRSIAPRTEPPHIAAPGGDDRSTPAAAVVATALVPAVWWLTQRIHPTPVRLVIAVACLWGGLTGWLAAAPADDGALQWVAAAAAVLLVAATMRSVTPVATPHLAAATVLVVAAAGGARWLAPIRSPPSACWRSQR
jgi:hypothetical protein